MGAVAATGAMPAIPAMAATISVPGIGDFEVPVPEEFEPAVEQLNDQIQQALGAPPPAVPQDLGLPEAPQALGLLPGLFGEPSTAGDVALEAARTKIGAQYSWGAAGPVSFDCSGLVQWAFRQAGIELPRTSFEQSHVGAPVAYRDMAPGDIVITNGGGHVGIYAGDNLLLNAVQAGQPVTYTSLRPDMVVTARRIL